MENYSVNLQEAFQSECGRALGHHDTLQAISPYGNGKDEAPAYKLARQLKDALAAEMQEYCGLLQLLSSSELPGPDRTLLTAIAQLEKQMVALAGARQQKELCQREFARYLQSPEDDPLPALIPQAPAPFQPALNLLLRQNQRLLQQIQHKMQDNLSVISRWMDSVHALRQTIDGWKSFPLANAV